MSALQDATQAAREQADEIRAEVWEGALRRHDGNLAHAGEELGFSRQRGHVLTKRHGLLELAAQLREEAGQPPTGRPRVR